MAGLAAAALTALAGTGTAAAQERGETEPVSGDIVVEEGLELRGTLDDGPFDVWANVLGLEPHGGEEVLRVYCIDIRTDLDQESPYTEGEWEESGVANLEKVRWVLTNGHPNAAPERLFAESGVQPAESWDETEAARVAYAGTQAAVWHFTDGFELDLEAAVIGGTDEQIDGVAAVYEHLTGNAGRLPDPSEFYIELDGVEEASYEDGRFGPYTVRSGAGPVELSAEGGRLVDSGGDRVEHLDDGEDFYIVLDEGSTEITIGGRATYDLPVGRVFRATTAESLSGDAGKPVTSGDSQQLILAQPRESEVPAEWGFALQLPDTDRPTEESAQPKLPATGASLTMAFVAGLALLVGGLTVLALARRRTAAE
ncbi:Cys-Gln thioester bond-forming surface protein [Glycomyces sp. L485]|uniref:Cys-Gln thioester bond-forming surface protein n=1 Tax=Glycomyces sp. L485 TaxID=2909235 RepID=UPI001F4B5B6D|nr:Cys-Gln thioester bond-forming surface protein [Glycomyces sp. L485]MCH7230624.1 Cys-Gln thioester bond-forming surface protein [Glycomyces sp. L485]